MSRVVLVTGASSGFGCETAALLVRRGYRVFGTCLPGEQSSDLPFDLIPLDLADPLSVEACVSEVIDRTGRIDVLVNNAGVILLGAVEETSISEAQRLFEVNFFGTARITRAVLPHMRGQGGGRIITITSLAGLIGAPYQGYYAASKHALEGLFESLKYEVEPFGIRVSLIEPGIARTPLPSNKWVAREPLSVYDAPRDRVLARWEHFVKAGMMPSAVAETVARTIGHTSPPFRQVVGQDALRGAVAKRFLPFASVQNGVSEELHVIPPEQAGPLRRRRRIKQLTPLVAAVLGALLLIRKR